MLEVEALSAPDAMGTSESGEVSLKSCPSKIIIKPGRCKIFRVFSTPSANLHNLGLEFSLSNPEIGILCGPMFMRCRGNKKYNIAYGLLYCKRDVDTPLDTSINVTTSQGQSLSIPVQVVKNTAAVSGKIYTDTPLLRGWVLSIGPRSFARVDGDGNYVLPRVFMGTGRKICATWWTQEGNKRIKHREVKYVDVMGDTVVDFGVMEPRHPLDPYYQEIVIKIDDQKQAWEEEIGVEEGVQKTVDWLNRQGSVTLPPEISEAIAVAKVDEYNPKQMWIRFADENKLIYHFTGEIPDFFPPPSNDYLSQKELLSHLPVPVKNDFNSTKNVETVKNLNIISLAPFRWQMIIHTEKTVGKYFAAFPSTPYEIKVKEMAGYKGLGGISENPDILFEVDSEKSVILTKIVNEENIIRPQDFENLNEYGIIHIATHGSPYDILACPLYNGDSEEYNGFDKEIYEWIEKMEALERTTGKDLYCFGGSYYPIKPPSFEKKPLLPSIGLTRDFFNMYSFDGSLVFLECCWGWEFHQPEINDGWIGDTVEAEGAFSDAKVFLGNDRVSDLFWSREIAYFYFCYLAEGFKTGFSENLWDLAPPENQPQLPDPYPSGDPMSVKAAHDIFGGNLHLNPDPQEYRDIEGNLEDKTGCVLMLDTQDGLYDDTYFPAPGTIVVY